MAGGKGSKNSNQLVVEDNDLFDAVTSLMRKRIPGWPADYIKDGAPVHIRNLHSANEALDTAFLDSLMKEPNFKILGVLVDAEEVFTSRWDTIKRFAEKRFPGVPDECPQGGLILQGDENRFGAWIMPDNKSNGMLEDMCFGMVPKKHETLWTHAGEIAAEALKHGAKYKNVHAKKAVIHTYLALQDPPGERLGAGISKKFFDANATCCNDFVAWFKALYQL